MFLHTKVWSSISFIGKKTNSKLNPQQKKPKQTNKTGEKKRPPNQTVPQYFGRAGFGKGHFPHLPVHLTHYISEPVHDPLPSSSGWHNSSMPLAMLRAQSITDSHNHFTSPWAPDFHLAAIPHTPAKTHQETSDLTAEYCVTEASRRQEPEDINDEDAKCRALAQLSTQHHLREGFLWCTTSCRQAQGLLCHFKLIKSDSNSSLLFSMENSAETGGWTLACVPLHETRKRQPQNTRNSDIWEVWRRSGSDLLLKNRSDLSYTNYHELNFFPIGCVLLAVSTTLNKDLGQEII